MPICRHKIHFAQSLQNSSPYFRNLVKLTHTTCVSSTKNDYRFGKLVRIRSVRTTITISSPPPRTTTVSFKVRFHVQQQVVLVFGLFVAHGTLEFGVDAALEPHVPTQAVQPRVRVAAPGAGVRRNVAVGRGRLAAGAGVGRGGHGSADERL